MGDTTAFQMRIYDCDPDEVAAILEIINQYQLSSDWSYDSNAAEIDMLVLCDNYGAYEVRCGTASDVAEELRMNAPNAAWELWEDPKYEWLGDYWAHVDPLGTFSHSCDSDGQPVFTGEIVKALLASPDELDLKLGLQHAERLTELRELTQETVLYDERHRCSACGGNESDLEDGMCGGCWHDARRSGWEAPSV